MGHSVGSQGDFVHPRAQGSQGESVRYALAGVTDLVKIRFTKWGEIAHWSFDMHRLGEDEHGTWLWMPPGTEMRRGAEEPVTSRNGAVKLITKDQWWTAIWNEGETSTFSCYVDIATPAVWDGETVRMVDLDLDVAVRRGGGVEVHDEDEFEEHLVRYAYPDHVVDKARTETARIVVAVEREDPPFDGTASHWLEVARGR